MFGICCKPRQVNTGIFVKKHIHDLDKETEKIFGNMVKALLLQRDMVKLPFGGKYHYKLGNEIHVEDNFYCTLVNYKGIEAALTSEGRMEFFKVQEHLEQLEKLNNISKAREVFGL